MTHVVPHNNFNNGYPMYFQVQPIKDSDLFLIDICHNEPVAKGDTFKKHQQDLGFTIQQIVESREPGKTGKNNHAHGVTWHQIKCSMNKA